MERDDNDYAASAFAGYGPYWRIGTLWGTPPIGPDGQMFPHGHHLHPGVPEDRTLRQIIRDAIDRNPAIHGNASIIVDVEDGVVTLRGTLRSGAAKRAAGNAAWFAPGVSDVHNQIEVSTRSHKKTGG